MVMNVVGHWLLGLPSGYVLCFVLGWGVLGLWVGLSIGLIFVALVLTVVWMRRTRHLILPGGVHPADVPDLL
jgi:MATE family multidrug resistance protein